MIELIEKTIIDKLFSNEKKILLSFVKYSTPTSGKNLDDKVIFFVFKDKDKEPFFVVKTVRNYGAKEIIIRNFNNLKKLNRLTENSSYTGLFAKALYLCDNSENIFSIESACSGGKTRFNKKKLNTIVREYIGFQEYLAKNNNEFIDDFGNFARDIVYKSELSERDKKEILEFLNTQSFGEIKLPKLIQHGDLTEDNILISRNKINIIDYDYVGITNLPGFDLFGLFYRYNPRETKKLCEKYFSEYFKKIGAEISNDKYDKLLFVYYFIERVIRKKHLLKDIKIAQIISDFNNLLL